MNKALDSGTKHELILLISSSSSRQVGHQRGHQECRHRPQSSGEHESIILILSSYFQLSILIILSSYFQLSLPHIDPYHSTNITALAGANTRLNCRVYRWWLKIKLKININVKYINIIIKRLGNKTVSWMRKDRLHLLTVGRLKLLLKLSGILKLDEHKNEYRFTDTRTPRTWGMRQVTPSTAQTGAWCSGKESINSLMNLLICISLLS